MARQNRVTPWGEIVATPERGLFMGNRGRLHNEQGRLTARSHTTLAWIICLLEFRGRTRQVMTPGRYTELFFLDEPTALAAGHRPCGECRNRDYRRFKALWLEANPAALASAARVPILRIDEVLHGERMAIRDDPMAFRRSLQGLPDGAMAVLEQSEMSDSPTAWLVWGDALYPWTPGGYGTPRARPPGITVGVLTPPSLLRTLDAGLPVRVHPSASQSG